MIRRTLYICAALVAVAAGVSAQVRVPPCDYWCRYFDGPRPPLLRLIPEDNRLYEMPQAVGVVQGGNFEPFNENSWITQRFTLSELFDDITGHGIRVASVHTKSIPWSDNDPAFGDARLDVLIVWPMTSAWAHEEEGCDGVNRVIFSEYPTTQWAEWFYSMYGHQDRMVILTDWELDHGLRGIGCDCEAESSNEREWYVTRLIRNRQTELEEVRARYPDARLRVLYGPTLNRLPCNDPCPDAVTVAEIIAGLDASVQPDLVLVSFWCGDAPITDALERVRDVTGYDPRRIVVAELGRRQDRDQYAYIVSQVRAAWEFGSPISLIWHWRDTWCNENGRGMWEIKQPCNGRVEWGQQAPGYYAIRDLNEGR